MKFLNRIMVIMAVMQGGYLAAAEIQCSYTYNGQVMTPENILELAPKAPAELEEKVQDFLLSKPDLIELFSGIAHYNKLPFYGKAPYAFNFKGMDAPMQGYLESMAMAIARANAGIQIPQNPQQKYNRVLSNVTVFLGPEWVIKSSGFLNRRANILHEVGMDNLDPELPQDKL